MNNLDDQLDTVEVPDTKPNETGGFYFSSFVKITDPVTKEILVQTRGDN